MVGNRYTKSLAVKGVMEDLFGSDVWYDLKESDHIPTWRKHSSNALRAIHLAINDTVKVYDVDWKSQIEAVIERGLSDLGKAKEVDEMVGVLAASFLQLSFLQVGHMPRLKGKVVRSTLRKGAWKLDIFRSVQYIQTEEQREQYFWHNQQRRIGFGRQFDLHAEYKRSGAKEPYSEWCAWREDA